MDELFTKRIFSDLDEEEGEEKTELEEEGKEPEESEESDEDEFYSSDDSELPPTDEEF